MNPHHQKRVAHQRQQQLNKQQQMLLQQQQLQQQQRINNNNNHKLPIVTTINTSRKRSHSNSSSTCSSSASPASNNLFSTTNSSDSGTSSMISIKSNSLVTKKKRATQKDSSLTDLLSKSPQVSSNSFTTPIVNNKQQQQQQQQQTPRLTAQRSVPAFLNKLYNMVEDLSTNDLIRWSKDGTSFIVEKHEEFAKTVLPRFYKHNTFASFVRQLNMYDFHKVPHLQQGVLIAESEHEIWEFSNPHFQKGRPDLLVLVTRKRNRDRDIVDPENISLSSLVQDLSTIKKYQSTMGTELRDLHRDNEILWQETLNAREKYQRHQEAIEKILQFLTSIFANDHLAISMNNMDTLPKGLIEEAASLAGMPKLDEMTADIGSKSMAAATTSSLSNILSSALRLYNNGANQLPYSALQQHQQQQQQHNIKEEDRKPSLVDFSKTLNIATKSAQSITQDIDMLQVNIESLANNLGIDSSQFDDDMESDCYFIDHAADSGGGNNRNCVTNNNNNTAISPTENSDELVGDDDRNKSNYHSCQQTTNRPSYQYNFNLQNLPPSHYSNNNNSASSSSFSMMQQRQGDQYCQLMSSINNNNNYSDSFDPNYPTSSGSSNDDYSQSTRPYYATNGTTTSNESLLNATGTTAAEYNAMVNEYTDMIRPNSYLNHSTAATPVSNSNNTTKAIATSRDNYSYPS